jgi:hypothetical protein
MAGKFDMFYRRRNAAGRRAKQIFQIPYPRLQSEILGSTPPVYCRAQVLPFSTVSPVTIFVAKVLTLSFRVLMSV